jgi:hypothetical protein
MAERLVTRLVARIRQLFEMPAGSYVKRTAGLRPARIKGDLTLRSVRLVARSSLRAEVGNRHRA